MRMHCPWYAGCTPLMDLVHFLRQAAYVADLVHCLRQVVYIADLVHCLRRAAYVDRLLALPRMRRMRYP